MGGTASGMLFTFFILHDYNRAIFWRSAFNFDAVMICASVMGPVFLQYADRQQILLRAGLFTWTRAALEISRLVFGEFPFSLVFVALDAHRVALPRSKLKRMVVASAALLTCYIYVETRFLRQDAWSETKIDYWFSSVRFRDASLTLLGNAVVYILKMLHRLLTGHTLHFMAPTYRLSRC
eukprot:NODE_4817_length_638_cov_363.989708.p1 GENE.NODE_4817_length_638_cov_363.989708~~NODE_4817_length_638_cov_363.989708.p1  ORF type:complete len:180 (+),score=36.06 NODE_4817_length_638_cov_363.989708:3-542(+)